MEDTGYCGKHLLLLCRFSEHSKNKELVAADRPLERFPITWNHVIEEESLNINKLDHVLIEKVEQLFRDML
jgi:hypothetical protein